MSFWRNYYHIVWGTKDREPHILSDIEQNLYGYLVNKGTEMEVFTYAIGGWIDHIHLVVSIPPKQAVSYIVKVLKGSSSFYINHVIRPQNLHFVWQRGYGCLTLGETQLSKAEMYVNNQKQHHEENSINKWLESYHALDEGPKESRIIDSDIHSVQEPIKSYHVQTEEFPF